MPLTIVLVDHEADPAPPHNESSVPNGDSNGHPEATIDHKKPSEPVPAAEPSIEADEPVEETVEKKVSRLLE